LTSTASPLAPAAGSALGLSISAPRAARRDGALLLMVLIVLAAASKPVLYDTLDPDSFWHLRVADTIARVGVHPIVDDLSFNSIRTPWVPYSWLAELTMRAIWNTTGWRGTVAAQTMIVAAWTVLLLAASRELTRQADAASSNPSRDSGLRCCIATVAGLYLSLPYLSFRPVTFAFVLIALVALLVMRDRRRQTPLVWLAVVASGLCANVHLLAWTCFVWPMGLLIDDLHNARPWRRHALLTFLVAAASLATPLLPGMIRTAWGFQFQDAIVAQSGINELQSVFRGSGGVVLAAIVVGLLVRCWLARGRMGIAPLIWLAAASALLVRLGRFAPLYSLAAAPVLAALVLPLRDNVLGRAPVRAILAIVLAAMIWRITSQFPRPGTDLSAWLNRHGPDTPGYPCGAADFVSRLPAPAAAPTAGRIINEFNWGGYLAWRLGPRYQVFMDGRTQLYSRQFWFATTLGERRQCAQNVAATNADVAILPLKRTDWRDALMARGWRLAYQDDRAIVLVPAATARGVSE
jgi:hypothetical protein